MTLVTDKNTMHQYRSATVTEQKASGYSLKMSTWVKISRNYLDDSDQMLQKKAEIIYTAKKNFGSYNTFKQFSSYHSHRFAIDSNYSSL